MDPIQKISTFQGKRDRELQNIPSHDLYISLSPRTSTQQMIKSINDEINELTRETNKFELPCSDALAWYMSARSLRHDNMCDLLTECFTIPDYKVGDTLFESFCIKYNIKSINSQPTSIKNKTPDLLVMNPNTSIIYIGDIAVANSPQITLQRKHEKYMPLVNFLMSEGFAVVHVDCIFKSDRSNVQQVMQQLLDLGIIKHDQQAVDIAMAYFEVANNIMYVCKTFNTDPIEFNRVLDASSDQIKEDATLPNAPEDIIKKLPELYKPIRTEQEIIDMIKVEVEKYDINTYFNSDIQESVRTLDKIISDNKLKEHMKPKSTLQVVYNTSDIEEYTDHDLIDDYLTDLQYIDGNVADYLRHILPNKCQTEQMRRFKDKNNKIDIKNDQDLKDYCVSGPYQYKITSSSTNYQISDLNYKLTKGKQNKNEKSNPRHIDLQFIDQYTLDTDRCMSYLGSMSQKPSMFDDSWDAKTTFELENTRDEFETMKYVKHTNGAQLSHSMAMLYDRMTHLSIKQSQADNVFVPPNGAFICVIPRQHAPMTSKNVDIPMIFITRCHKGKCLNHIEYEYEVEGFEYRYYISKLCRLNIDRLSNWTNASCKLISSASYILSRCKVLNAERDMLVGMLTVLIIDSHQKVSEFTDLLKYISYMPFSQVHKMPDLIKDKMDLLIKTKLDAWMISKLKAFIIELSKLDLLRAKKPKLKTFNTTVMSDSLGIDAKLPSFISPQMRHERPADFIEEMNIIHCCRAKHLYGSQFMDKSITQTVDWNIEYEEEVKKYGGWALDGLGDGDFPFESKFCFSSDAIYYANTELNKRMGIIDGKVEAKLHKSGYARYMHENCSLRGCTKKVDERLNQSDIHTTSLDACLKYYKDNNYNEERCTSNYIAYRSLLSNEQQQYSMSEKDQRGGGRPIATPMLSTKAVLMMIEKPEQARGHLMNNNIIVPGINKAQAQCEAYKRALSDGVRLGYTKIYQLTEDQTKFSENDNVRKYLTYVRTNPDVNISVRAVQYTALEQILNRVHVVKRLPLDVKTSQERLPYVVNDSTTLGVRAIIGWPQGMLNCISTNVHAGADVWITKAYNIAYPDNTVHTVGLVHSDDSWVTVCCNSEADFKKFVLFRIIAKKLFCLKLNTKKLWGSGMMGELVSNYNLNGNVHLSVAKVIPNSFGNLNYQNWVMDVHNQVSVLQQCYRNGANLGTIIMLATILRQQILRCYQVKGKQLEIMHDIPVDIGGYPDASPFELAVCGLPSSYKDVLDKMKRSPNSESSKIIRLCLHWSINRIITQEQVLVNVYGSNKRKVFYERIAEGRTDSWSDDDFENLTIPSKGDIFKCIKHIMPKSRKLAKTVETIRSLPFESNGLEMLVSRPKSLSEALGHLKARASSMVYELAADKYTQNARRLAISQSIQSTGKVIKISNMIPMSFNDMYEIALSSDDVKLNTTLLSDAFDESNELVSCTYNIVHQSSHFKTNDDKRQVLSKMPVIDTKFKTVAPIQDVLLRIIDKHHKTNHVSTYCKLKVAFKTLDNDAEIIYKRFESYFNCHDTVTTCNLIMQQFLSVTKSRLWTQPYLRNESLLIFCEDLYGKTINSKYNYNIVSSISSSKANLTDVHIVQTLYNTCILNKLYPGKFEMIAYDNQPLSTVIQSIDYRNFDDNDMFKYGTVQYIINGNTDIFKMMYTNNVYRQRYLIPQRYNRHTKTYYGSFHCVCMMGSTVVVVKGEPGKTISLESNTTSVNSILKILKIFIDRNFHYEKYTNPSSWGTRAFWTYTDISEGPFLSYYNQYSTIISMNQSFKSIPIKIDTNLQFPQVIDKYQPDTYIVSDTLREIHYRDSSGKMCRLASIMQNFSLPHRNHVTIEPSPIQGIDNTELYSSGVIESLIMDNTTYVNSNIIENLLAKSIYGQLNSKGLILTYVKFMSKALGQEIEIPDNMPISDTEIVTVDIEGETPSTVADTYEETEPEDLSALFVEFTVSSNERIGRLHIIKDFHHSLAKAYIGSVSVNERDAFLKFLLCDKNIKDWYVKTRAEDNNIMSLNEIMSDIEDITPAPVDFQLYCYLLVHNFPYNETWLNIDLKCIDRYVDYEAIDVKTKKMGRLFVQHVALNIYEIDPKVDDNTSIFNL